MLRGLSDSRVISALQDATVTLTLGPGWITDSGFVREIMTARRGGGSKSGLVVVSRSRDNQAEKNDVNVVRLEGTAQDSDTNRLTQANCKTNEAFSLQILASQKNTI